MIQNALRGVWKPNIELSGSLQNPSHFYSALNIIQLLDKPCQAR